MKTDNIKPNKYHLFWISYNNLKEKLSFATWIETTRELRELGWNVTLVAVGDKDGKQFLQGVETLCFSIPNIYLIQQITFHLKALWLLINTRPSPDWVLFTQDSLPWMIPLIFLRKLLRIKKPLYVLDTRSVHMADPRSAGLRIRLRGQFIRLMNRLGNIFADGHTVITTRMGKALNIPGKKIWGVWTSGVTLAPFEKVRGERKWPGDHEKIKLIYIGTLSDERNIDGFCLAVIQKNLDGQKFHFTIVGDGPAREKLENIASLSNGCIDVLKTVPHNEIPLLLSKMHIGVLPFPDEEKFRVSSPVKLFEYAASGLPILATRIVCHTDVVGNNAYAFWIEKSDLNGFVTALKDVEKAVINLSVMGEEAAWAAKKLTWRESAQNLINALENGQLETKDIR